METLLSDINMMQLIIFITVVDEGGFSKAGNVLHMTQPAVTKSISRLEAALDLKLFNRTTRRMEITPQGRYLYEQWKPLLLQLQAAYHQVQQTNNVQELRIGTTSTTNPELYFWPLADRFKTLFPSVELQVESDSMEILTQKLIQHEYDLVFLPHFEHYSLDERNIPWKWAAINNVYAYMRKDHPLANKNALALSDLKDEGLIILDEAHNPNYIRDIYELFGHEGLRPNISRALRNAYTVRAAIRDLKGIIIADAYFDFSENDRITRLPLEGYFNGIICAWNPPVTTPGLQDFLEIIDKSCDIKVGDRFIPLKSNDFDEPR